MATNKAPKKKRELTDVNFEYDGAHIALCHKEQSVANMADYPLVLKTRNFSDEFIEKMQTVKVELELPEFLTRFFNVYGADAQVLARMMGYVPEESDKSEDYYAMESEDYIQSRLQAFELMKAAHESQDFTAVLSDLQEDEYLALLQDQELLEKAMKDMEESKVAKEIKRRKPKVKTTRSYTDPNAVVSKSTEVALATAEDKPHVASEVEEEVTTSVVKTKSKETLMTTEVKVVEQVVETEMIAKAEFDTIQKAFADIQVELQKAKDDVAAFKAEKQEAITKAKKAQLSAVVKNEKHLEALSKAALMLDGEDFDGFVTAVQELHKQADQSDLFIEKGATVSDEAPAVSESAVAKILKAKQSK